MKDEINSKNQQNTPDNKSNDSDLTRIEKEGIQTNDNETHTLGDKENDADDKSEIKRILHATKLTDRILAGANIILAVATVFMGWMAYMQWGSLEKTDETSRMRDRAFLYFMDPTVIPYPPPKPAVWGISINIANAGNMPARSISIRYCCPESKRPNNISDPFTLAEWSTLEVPNVIGPKQGVSLQGCNIPINTIEAAKMSEIDIFVLMEAEYIDGFELNKRRITQMSRIIRFDQHGGKSLGFAGAHNCTDDDCR